MENAVEIQSLGKMYRLFDKQTDRIRDLFGIDKLCFWDKKPRYREFWALRNVNLNVPKGERIGIIGRNGAGKSTLLKLITGNLKPTEGSVHVNGKIQALLQIGTGFHPDFTGLENIRTALAYAGMDRRRIEQSVEEIIEFSELEDYIHQPVKFYSAGMYSRLAFAVSTTLTPEILIIDEVLGAGDAAFISKCAERMKHLTQDTGATVLFVSHSMDSVLEICNRAILVERGEITHEGTALEVSKIYNKKIRAEEELRARAKEYRISRKSMLSIAQADEATQILVMRLVGDLPHPSYRHVIYHCVLKHGEATVSELRFGAPADDDPAQFTRVISDRGAMDWSEAKKAQEGFCRVYSNQEGRNCHAPFQMAIPIYLASEPLSVSVDALPDEREPVYLEYFDGQAYHRLGRLSQGTTTFSLCLKKEEAVLPGTEATVTAEETPPQEEARETAEETPPQEEARETVEETPPQEEARETAEETPPQEKARETAEETPPQEEARETAEETPPQEKAKALMKEELRQTNSTYGTEEGVITIEKLDILDAEGKSTRSFFTGESLRFQIQLALHQKTEGFIAVVCIMSTSGKTATQVFCDSRNLGVHDESMAIEARFAPLRLGAGDYMASIGIFKSCEMSRVEEEPSYCVADRALFFKVEQPFMVRKALGSILHTCEWRCGEAVHVFDGTNLENGEEK